jgi:hypothetical protein
VEKRGRNSFSAQLQSRASLVLVYLSMLDAMLEQCFKHACPLSPPAVVSHLGVQTSLRHPIAIANVAIGDASDVTSPAIERP